jgi:hypothetical protein
LGVGLGAGVGGRIDVLIASGLDVKVRFLFLESRVCFLRPVEGDAMSLSLSILRDARKMLSAAIGYNGVCVCVE